MLDLSAREAQLSLPSCSFPGHQKEMLTLGVSAQGASTSAKRSVFLRGPAHQAE